VLLSIWSNDINGHTVPFRATEMALHRSRLGPGENVDLVLPDPYDWRGFKTNSIDVVISGQTFEHTEFFWNHVRNRSLLKPHGLVASLHHPAVPNIVSLSIAAILSDGLRPWPVTPARCARSGTQWTDLASTISKVKMARVDADRAQATRILGSGCGEPSLPAEALSIRFGLDAGTRVQAYYSSDGLHHEEDSVSVRAGHGTWEEVSINLLQKRSALPCASIS